MIFLSNGFDTRIQDHRYPERRVATIYSKRDLEKMYNLQRMRTRLHTIKIRQNKDRTLEKILWNEIGTRQEYERECGQKPLGEFVREIVGLDMRAAKSAFTDAGSVVEIFTDPSLWMGIRGVIEKINEYAARFPSPRAPGGALFISDNNC